MSFSFNTSGPVPQVRKAVQDDQAMPPAIKVYVEAGIAGLVQLYGEAANVAVSAQGHLFNGTKGQSEATTANVTVSGGP